MAQSIKHTTCRLSRSVLWALLAAYGSSLAAAQPWPGLLTAGAAQALLPASHALLRPLVQGGCDIRTAATSAPCSHAFYTRGCSILGLELNTSVPLV